MKRFLFVGVGICALSATLGATVWVGFASAPACERQYRFVRDINGIPQNLRYYRASDCEMIFVDHMAVVLPPLETSTKPIRVTVRNVGSSNVIVGSGDGLINPIVNGYTTSAPQVPIWTGGDGSVFLKPGQGTTFVAMPNKLAKAWFTE